MTGKYGKLVRQARAAHDPPLNAKTLADSLAVKPSFITDIEKGRRLPSLQTQKKIKDILAGDKFPTTTFDDLAASDNEDPRIVAEDLASALRKEQALRKLIRTITDKHISAAQIHELTATLGGMANDAE